VLPALLLVHVLASPARAERAHAALTLAYAPGPLAARCPREKVLHDEIGRRIGYDPFRSDSPARLTVTIEGSKQAYRVTGKIRDADRETFSDTFVDADCTAAVTMMARALAAELTTIPASEPEPLPVPVPVPDPPPATEPPPVAALPAPIPARAHLRAAAGAAVAFNLSPAVLTGPVVSAGLRYSFVSVALEGRALFGPTVDAGGVGVTSSYYAGSLGACGHYAALFGCGRVELGSLRFALPDGVRHAALDFIVAGAGLRIGAEWFFVEHVALSGYADLRIDFTRPIELRSAVDDRVAWASSQPSLGMGLGLVVSY
jgi:hypothetical protein